MTDGPHDPFRETVLEAIRACSLPSRDDAPPIEEELHRPFEDLGFDSLSYMEFCISITMETGIDMTVGRMKALGTPTAVADYLRNAG
jgi:acyl carrier protein